MTDDERPSPIFERGDVVYGDDPFKKDEAARPWLVLSNHEDIDFWQGRLETGLVDEAVTALVDELR